MGDEPRGKKHWLEIELMRQTQLVTHYAGNDNRSSHSRFVEN